MQTNKLIAIVGPTASGKSDLAVQLAQKFDGEIISADSRQVYKGLDIGSAKITREEMRGIPHYLLDIASPKRSFTVAQYQKLALKAIRKIQKKGKLPILVGGSSFYIYSVIDGIVIPEVKPDFKLRKKLEKLSTQKLYEKLKALDHARSIAIDPQNRRRLIRALEIVIKTGKPVPKFEKKPPPYPVLMIGIERTSEELRKRIKKRLLYRIDRGLVNEVRQLRKSGLSWKRLENFGLEYRYVAQYLEKKLTKQEMIARIQRETEAFARRQIAWFKKDPRIHWIFTYSQAQNLVKSYLREGQ
jgi:tRNA dimethylallyltransferase